MMRLCVITLLTGSLAMVGCGDSNGGTGGNGATGGSGATGGTGTGGTGGTGTGGTGGTACVTDCGVGNEFPTGAAEASETFTCSVMGIALGLEGAFAGVPQADPVGDVDLELSAAVIISPDTVNLITALADSAEIQATTGIANPIDGTIGEAANFVLSGTPCTVCFVRDTEVMVTIDPTSGSYTSDGLTVDVELSEITVEINAAGIALILSNAGDDPACCWGTDCNNPADPPAISVPLPQ